MGISEKTGGPAFPLHPSQIACSDRAGMTIRDYFAAMVLQACESIPRTVEPPPADLSDRARYCYRVADAMLKARK